MHREMTLPQRLGAGLAGTAALTLAHEIAHRVAPEAPRLDVMGMRAIVRGLRAAGDENLPRGRTVPMLSWAADLALNSAFYGWAVGRRPGAWLRGALAGLGAGLAAALLGPRFGLNETTGYHWGRRSAIVALYALGGAAAGAATRAIVSR
jgi:hypothetical protein